MKIRFLADVNLSAAIVEGVLRLEASIDFQTHRIAGLDRKADPEVLRIVAESSRLLVTHDRNTMPAHFSPIHPRAELSGHYRHSSANARKVCGGRSAPDVGGFGS